MDLHLSPLSVSSPGSPPGRRWPRPQGLARAGVLLSLTLGIFSGAACGENKANPQVAPGEADRVLFERGSDALAGRKWLTAREYFRQIVDGYPQSAYRADAKLGLGDTYLGEETAQSLVLAVNEFREFLSFYPTHPRADYAQYKLAMCHYTQMAKPERDQTESKEAVKEFEVFLERFPNSQLTEDARLRHRESRDRLSESDYRVGLFYYRSRWYPGAIDRFKALLQADPQYTGRDAVYFHLAEALAKVNREAEALPYLQRLLDEFERSEFLEDAKKRMAELKASAAVPKEPAGGQA